MRVFKAFLFLFTIGFLSVGSFVYAGNDETSPKVTAREEQSARCSICHDDVADDSTDIIRCPHDNTPVHKDCVQEENQGKCTACGNELTDSKQVFAAIPKHLPLNNKSIQRAAIHRLWVRLSIITPKDFEGKTDSELENHAIDFLNKNVFDSNNETEGFSALGLYEKAHVLFQFLFDSNPYEKAYPDLIFYLLKDPRLINIEGWADYYIQFVMQKLEKSPKTFLHNISKYISIKNLPAHVYEDPEFPKVITGIWSGIKKYQFRQASKANFELFELVVGRNHTSSSQMGVVFFYLSLIAHLVGHGSQIITLDPTIINLGGIALLLSMPLAGASALMVFMENDKFQKIKWNLFFEEHFFSDETMKFFLKDPSLLRIAGAAFYSNKQHAKILLPKIKELFATEFSVKEFLTKPFSERVNYITALVEVGDVLDLDWLINDILAQDKLVSKIMEESHNTDPNKPRNIHTDLVKKWFVAPHVNYFYRKELFSNHWRQLALKADPSAFCDELLKPLLPELKQQ